MRKLRNADIGGAIFLVWMSLFGIISVLAIAEKIGEALSEGTPEIISYETNTPIHNPVAYITANHVEEVEIPEEIEQVIVPKKNLNLPRGVRNNNPLNIRVGNKWQGLAPMKTDHAFDEFINESYGFRAAAKVLLTYQNRYGLKTINDMIHRFAPPSENNTSSYVAFVSKKMGVSPFEPIDLTGNPELIAKLLHAMSIIEVGTYYSYQDALKGALMATSDTG